MHKIILRLTFLEMITQQSWIQRNSGPGKSAYKSLCSPSLVYMSIANNGIIEFVEIVNIIDQSNWEYHPSCIGLTVFKIITIQPSRIRRNSGS